MKTSFKPNKRFSVRAGFSLVELLVVIAVIGIIAAIAIPNIAGLTGGAETAKNRRNAQSIASTFSAARAAGYTGSFASGAETGAIGEVVTGITVNGATFQVPNLSSTDQADAAEYLTISVPTGGDATTSQLIYNATP